MRLHDTPAHLADRLDDALFDMFYDTPHDEGWYEDHGQGD